MRLGVGDAFIQKPGVHLVIGLESQPRREEALTHETDLVLDLALLPSRCRRAAAESSRYSTAQKWERHRSATGFFVVEISRLMPCAKQIVDPKVVAENAEEGIDDGH